VVARPALVRILFLAVALAPIVRVTCDVSCILVPEPPPPPCHETSQGEPDACSHDHGQVAARVAIPQISYETAIVSVVAILPTPAAPIPIDVIGEATPVAPPKSPQAILRV
jgi:hypothetical protein